MVCAVAHCRGRLSPLQCSASCGDGVMERMVRCVSAVLQESHGCSPESKPEARKVCRNPNCECHRTHNQRVMKIQTVLCVRVKEQEPNPEPVHIPLPSVFTHLLVCLPGRLPASCLEVRSTSGLLVDGEHQLSVAGKPLRVRLRKAADSHVQNAKRSLQQFSDEC